MLWLPVEPLVILGAGIGYVWGAGIVQWWRLMADRKVLENNTDLLETIAEALLERETLDNDEIKALMAGETLPEKQHVKIPTYAEKKQAAKDDKDDDEEEESADAPPAKKLKTDHDGEPADGGEGVGETTASAPEAPAAPEAAPVADPSAPAAAATEASDEPTATAMEE